MECVRRAMAEIKWFWGVGGGLCSVFGDGVKMLVSE
jgi:hypothetical protein